MLFATLEQRPLDADALLHFPAEMLMRGRQFTREVRLAATLKSLTSLGLLLALCFHPLGARLLGRLERLGRGRLWLELIAVITGITLLITLAELPFSFYLGFWHERVYGLSRQAPSGWLLEHLTGVVMEVTLSLLLWLPLYWLIRRAPRGWWLPASILSAGMSALMVALYPVLILPLSGEITPVRDPRVITMVERLADRAGVRIDQVRELKISDKSTRINAMVTGLGPTKQVVLYNTLLDQMSSAEVEVVLAHELAHALHGDILRGWLLNSLLSVVGFLLAAWLLREMCQVAPLTLPRPHAARGVALLILFLTLFDTVAAPLQNGATRRMEVKADAFALEVTKNPRALVTSFQKLAQANPGDVAPPPLVEWLSHSHPSVLSRIRQALLLH